MKIKNAPSGEDINDDASSGNETWDIYFEETYDSQRRHRRTSCMEEEKRNVIYGMSDPSFSIFNYDITVLSSNYLLSYVVDTKLFNCFIMEEIDLSSIEEFSSICVINADVDFCVNRLIPMVNKEIPLPTHKQ